MTFQAVSAAVLAFAAAAGLIGAAAMVITEE